MVMFDGCFVGGWFGIVRLAACFGFVEFFLNFSMSLINNINIFEQSASIYLCLMRETWKCSIHQLCNIFFYFHISF